MQAKKKHVPIGGKRHHTNQSLNYMANYMVAVEQGKLWEGRRRKINSNSDGDRDRQRQRVLRVERFVTFSMFGVYS